MKWYWILLLVVFILVISAFIIYYKKNKSKLNQYNDCLNKNKSSQDGQDCITCAISQDGHRPGKIKSGNCIPNTIVS